MVPSSALAIKSLTGDCGFSGLGIRFVLWVGERGVFYRC